MDVHSIKGKVEENMDVDMNENEKNDEDNNHENHSVLQRLEPTTVELPILSNNSEDSTPIIDYSKLFRSCRGSESKGLQSYIESHEVVPKKRKIENNKIKARKDEYEVFHHPKVMVPKYSSYESKYSFRDEKGSVKSIGNFIRGECLKEWPEVDTHLPESSFHKVNLVTWESDIMWEAVEPQVNIPKDGVKSTDNNQLSKKSTNGKKINAQDSKEKKKWIWEIDNSLTSPVKPRQFSKDKTNGPLRSVLNMDLLQDSWLSQIRWDAHTIIPSGQLILDQNDTNLVFCIPGIADVRPTLRIPKRKMGAAEQRRAQLEQQAKEKKQRIAAVMGNLDFGEETAEGRLGTEAKKSKDTRIIKNMGMVHHSLPAIKLVLTKPELPRAKLREFHRPRAKFRLQESIILAPWPKDKLQQDGSTVVNQIRKPSDLLPTTGKLIFLEYSEEFPPLLPNPGMASQILHYWRAPDKSDAQPPETNTGRTLILRENDDSPFVGDVPPGRMITTLNTKMLKVPIFLHKPKESGLFLLAKSVPKGSKKVSSFKGKNIGYITEISSIYCAGQVEPQMEVPAPNSRSANDFIRPYMSFHILRLFKKASDGERLKIEDVSRAFPNQSGTAIRKRMKEIATFERGGNDSGWWKKKPESQMKSEDELRANVTPESVCLYESMMSGHRKLIDTGITKLTTPVNVNTALDLILKRLENRKEALAAMVNHLSGKAKEKAVEELIAKDQQSKNLEHEIQVARFIHDELQLTPWNLTNNYVECHLQGKGSGMLKLGGIGDPTGRGEGFSFIRIPQARGKKREIGPMNDDSDENANKAVAAVTGTTSDLRKLKMKEAGEVLRNLGMPEADIKKLRRWDRIHMVRELSSRATAHGVAGTLSKFARGSRKSLSAQQQEYRKKCDVIYERQMDVLSNDKAEFSSDEEGEDDDDDLMELEKDLEDDILGADKTEISRRGPKNLFSKGGGGLNRSKEVLAEREDAAELRRLMEEMKEDSGKGKDSLSQHRRPDIDSGKLREQLQESGIFSTSMDSDSASASQGISQIHSTATSIPGSPKGSINFEKSNTTSPEFKKIKPSLSTNIENSTKREVLKRVTRIIQEDGSETARIEFILDSKLIKKFKIEEQKKERQRRIAAVNQLKRKRKQLSAEEAIEEKVRAKRRKEQEEEGFDDGLKLKLKARNIIADSNTCSINITRLEKFSRQHEADLKKKKILEAKQQAELYKKPYAQISVQSRKVRLPICHLNSIFEAFLYMIYDYEESSMFRTPVDGNAVPDYYTIITTPMDFSTIQGKIEHFKYTSTKEFLKDLEQIALNSKKYNGEAGRSEITRMAQKMVSRAKEDLEILNAQGEITHMEKMTRKAGDMPVIVSRRTGRVSTANSVISSVTGTPVPSTSTPIIP